MEDQSGGTTPGNDAPPAFEYTAQAVSPIVNGQVKLVVGQAGLTVSALFDTAHLVYADIQAISIFNHVVTVKADSGDFVFSQMGSWGQRFFDALSAAYNQAMLRAMFVKGAPIVQAKGEFRFVEEGLHGGAQASVSVFSDCVAGLTANLLARRVPLSFVTGLDQTGFAITLTSLFGDSYTFDKLGSNTTPFIDAVTSQVRLLRESSLAAIAQIDPSLDPVQASQLAKMMPLRTAAPFGQLAEIAPSFVTGIEERIAATRAVESYQALKQFGQADRIWVGLRPNEAAKDDSSEPGGIATEALGGLASEFAPSEVTSEAEIGSAQDNAQPVSAEPYLIWVVAPSPDGQYAIAEFAEADAATFVFRTGGDFAAFARQLNRALEAISFKREVIRLSDQELRQPQYADYLMASKYTAALRLVRSSFAGRVIHSNPEVWRSKLTELFSSPATPPAVAAPVQSSFCGQCGAPRSPSVTFCQQCGARLGR
ncbi:MAG: zinc ribbon domain-containing protein [Micrococcales bacterium]|nr:zinc ribbon domain-containing protein [Micrococcales bacterium]